MGQSIEGEHKPARTTRRLFNFSAAAGAALAAARPLATFAEGEETAVLDTSVKAPEAEMYTSDTSVELNLSLKPNYQSPNGFLMIDNTHPEDPEKTPVDGFKPRLPISEKQIDEYLGKYDIRLKFVRNPNLRTARLGSYSIYLAPEGHQRFAILRPITSVEDRTISMEFNFLIPDHKVTPEFLAEEGRVTAGTVSSEMARILYGKSVDEAADESQQELQRVTQHNAELQGVINPFLMVAPTA